jgi:hypothetical protein
MDLDSPYIGFREAIRQQAGYPTPPGGALGRVGFADFVAYIAEQPDDQRDGHWKLQRGMLHPDVICYDFIGRVETFSRDFTKVLQRFAAPASLLATLSECVNTTAQLPLAVAYHKHLTMRGIVGCLLIEGVHRKSWNCMGAARLLQETALLIRGYEP